jgi:hypothetical protein
MTTNELKLAEAFRDAGFPQDKAEAVSQTIFDAIRDNVATKADVELVRHDLTATGQALRGDVALVRSDLETRLAQLETRLSVRMGAMVTAAVAILVGVKFFG